MTSMLTNTTDALLMSLIVSAVTTGPTVRHGDAENDYGGTFDATTPVERNVALFSGPTHCNTTVCSMHPISKKLAPGFSNLHATFTSTETRLDAQPKPKSLTISIVVGGIAGLVSVVTIVGNIVVIGTIIREPKLRYSTNYFLMSLAISDLWIGVVPIPLYTYYILHGSWQFGRFWCDLVLCLDLSICSGSQYTVFLITLDRYLSITAPVMYRNWRTDKKVIWSIAAVWIIPSCLYPPLVLAYEPDNFVRIPTECTVPYLSDPWLTFIIIVADFWVFTLLMVYFYYRIYLVARNVRKNLDAKTSGKELMNSTKRNVTTSLQLHTNSNANKSWQNVSECPFTCLHDNVDISNGNIRSKQTTKCVPDYPQILKSSGDPNTKTSRKNNNNNYGGDSTHYTDSNRYGNASSSLRTGGTDSEKAANTSTDRTTIIKGAHGLFVAKEAELNDGSSIDPCAVHIFSQPLEPREVVSASTAKSMARDNKTFKTISVVFGAYLFFWSPVHILGLLRPLCGYNCVNPGLFQFTYLLCYLNSSINPFLYAYANDKFKANMKQFMKCCCLRT